MGEGHLPGERGHLCDAPERGREGSGDTPGGFLKSLSLGQRLEELQTVPELQDPGRQHRSPRGRGGLHSPPSLKENSTKFLSRVLLLPQRRDLNLVPELCLSSGRQDRLRAGGNWLLEILRGPQGPPGSSIIPSHPQPSTEGGCSEPSPSCSRPPASLCFCCAPRSRGVLPTLSLVPTAQTDPRRSRGHRPPHLCSTDTQDAGVASRLSSSPRPSPGQGTVSASAITPAPLLPTRPVL